MDRHHKITLPTMAATPLYREVIFFFNSITTTAAPQVASGFYLFLLMTNMHKKGFGLGI